MGTHDQPKHDAPVAAMTMQPACGERHVRYVGDTIRFVLRDVPPGHRAVLRTAIGRAAALRRGVIRSIQEPEVQLESTWRDVPMTPTADGWELRLALSEVGWFQSKAYTLDADGQQHWPEGDNIGIAVHPNSCRTANTIYCAFPRMFGPNKPLRDTSAQAEDERVTSLDHEGYTVIPPSGTFRALKSELPHIFETLGCRILHLLPVNPTPTTFARMGRFGSPYACGDLTAIDPALVEFDKRTTGVEQFCELTDAVHGHGGQVFVDLVINHTGWGSTLQNEHPEWFLREGNGDFASPGAWGVTWGDLVELEPHHRGLWEYLAEAFLTWCRRGVDGFRCDAGYKVPMPVWRYIIARVREEFPNAIFLLEGLGGGWEDTENLLTHGGMQWAYSELFQEYDGHRVAAYLDHALPQSQRVGTLVHYSETHDNERLASKGRAWSLLRNRLCALTSISGGFGFTNGVEWLADERVNVHNARGLRWGSEENIVPELAQLNRLLATHPCFFDGAKLTRLSADGAPVFALRRESPDGRHQLTILANTSEKEAHSIELAEPAGCNVLGETPPIEGGQIRLAPAQVACLSLDKEPPADLDYQRQRAQAAWAMQCLAERFEPEQMGALDWQQLAELTSADPEAFLAALSRVEGGEGLMGSLRAEMAAAHFPQVNTWRTLDATRVMPVHMGHWLLVRDAEPFRVSWGDQQVESIPTAEDHVAAFPPRAAAGEATLQLRRLQADAVAVEGSVRVLSGHPVCAPFDANAIRGELTDLEHPTVLLTNGRGAMARLGVDFGRVKSKYDCLLGANLHPNSPVDRHVFAKRARIWAVADGFITPLNAANLLEFQPGPPARWRFLVSAGDSRAVEVEVCAEMVAGENTTRITLHRRDQPPTQGRLLAPDKDFSLTVRVDIEDRSFHGETHMDDAYESFYWDRVTCDEAGFRFEPEANRKLTVRTTHGQFHPDMEWCREVPHPVEASRGQAASGDACSPGWFELPMVPNDKAALTIAVSTGDESESNDPEPLACQSGNEFAARLHGALQQFVVRRGDGQTVIAGYPWFLDWGRDTFIAARGLLAAGWDEAVRGMVLTFARMERDGTLPNALHGTDDSNRDTSDAPLWFGLVCEELAAKNGAGIYDEAVGEGRHLREVLVSIGEGYRDGTPNGIVMDPASGLVWSPSHFTWMDTNHPPGTPREGYPIEIQALWIRLLRQLYRLQPDGGWSVLEQSAAQSLDHFFGNHNRAWLADCLQATAGQSAAEATVDTALRCNSLVAIALGVAGQGAAQATVAAARDYLVVPGAMRTLAPLPVDVPLFIRGQNDELLNDPGCPYAGRYVGDEDTQRKPAYHNGTAWGWMLPVFCEAMVRAWPNAPESVAAAKGYLLSVGPLLNEGCLGQLPEIIDGDAPHLQRGCDAQAWSASEAYRVWRLLHEQDH